MCLRKQGLVIASAPQTRISVQPRVRILVMTLDVRSFRFGRRCDHRQRCDSKEQLLNELCARVANDWIIEDEVAGSPARRRATGRRRIAVAVLAHRDLDFAVFTAHHVGEVPPVPRGFDDRSEVPRQLPRKLAGIADDDDLSGQIVPHQPYKQCHQYDDRISGTRRQVDDLYVGACPAGPRFASIVESDAVLGGDPGTALSSSP